MNANSFTAPNFRVETQKFRFIGHFENLKDALECANEGRSRLVYKHNRPAAGCEGNYSLICQSGEMK
jgi:hypothetical protein